MRNKIFFGFCLGGGVGVGVGAGVVGAPPLPLPLLPFPLWLFLSFVTGFERRKMLTLGLDTRIIFASFFDIFCLLSFVVVILARTSFVVKQPILRVNTTTAQNDIKVDIDAEVFIPTADRSHGVFASSKNRKKSSKRTGMRYRGGEGTIQYNLAR